MADDRPPVLTNAADVLDDLVALARNDRATLERLRDFLAELEDVAARARVIRDYTCIRLREFGVRNIDIGDLAGLSDSYVSRMAIGAGQVRRLNRLVPTVTEAEGEEIGWCARCGCRIIRLADSGRWVEVAEDERQSCGNPQPDGLAVETTKPTARRRA